ncbi:hypothetical protein [Neorhodopirellula lusitana]|nr:hypothetical protein [Neorhodopirellula lusitana]
MTKTASSPSPDAAKSPVPAKKVNRSASKKAVKKSRKKKSGQVISMPSAFGAEPMPQANWQAFGEEVLAGVSGKQARSVFSGDVASEIAGVISSGENSTGEQEGAAFSEGQFVLFGLGLAIGASPSELQTKLAQRGAWSNRGAGSAERRGKKNAPLVAWIPSDLEREYWSQEAEQWVEANSSPLSSRDMPLSECVDAVLWASAIVPLMQVLPQELWLKVFSQLFQLRADAALEAEPTSGQHLLLAGELGLTLAWQLASLPATELPTQASLDAVATFLEGEADSIEEVLRRPTDIRLVVASLVRCRLLFPVVSKRNFKKRQLEISGELSTWMAVLMRQGGSQALADADDSVTQLDLGTPTKSGSSKKSSSLKKSKRGKSSKASDDGNPVECLGGLMRAASQFDSETLVPAIGAALGQSHSGGRLAWECTLPEAMWHSEVGKVVAMVPEWDVRRGRCFLDYSGEDVRVEIVGGKPIVLSGTHQTMIQIDGETVHPCGPWESTCEYSDDDVHMIELEQRFDGDVVLQRQWMLVRDDRCVMVSDAVLTNRRDGEVPEIVCSSRLPLADGMEVIEDEETREIILADGKKKRCMVLPLAAGEWRVGPSACQVSTSEDGHLVVQTRGRGKLYSPIWLDFQPDRFGRKRTWRTLTVAENLAMLPAHVACAFRVQSGSEHWVLYRSLTGRAPRSFMGKHLIADFFAARFHPGDGGMEELVTVDDSNSPEG